MSEFAVVVSGGVEVVVLVDLLRAGLDHVVSGTGGAATLSSS